MIFHARMVSDTGRIRVNKCCICDSDPQTHTRLPRSQKRSAFLTTDRLSDIPGKKFTLEVSVFSAFPLNSVLTHPGQSAVTVMPRSASSKESASENYSTNAFVAAYILRYGSG